ncbi:thy-1 membrane glycoprotein [Latimeria chalumnae]|uniref:thy-1 membrane glycoprotein n=1 Tax=Latimeria chalumnae TaxID=7897 RepID=UPI00313BC1CE
MNSMFTFTVILAVLPAIYAMNITSLNACLTKEQSLQVDCRYEAKSKEDLKYTFTLEEAQKPSRNVASNKEPFSQDQAFTKKVKVEVVKSENLVRLTLPQLEKGQEGTYVCKLEWPGAAPIMKSVAVYKGDLLACSAISLLIQNTSWLLCLLLSLPLLQAIDLTSL